jgi:hypothetical protein
MALETKIRVRQLDGTDVVDEIVDQFLRRSYDKHWLSRGYDLTGGWSTEITTGLSTINFLYVNSPDGVELRFYKKLSPEWITVEDALLLVGCDLSGFALRADEDTTVVIFAGGS